MYPTQLIAPAICIAALACGACAAHVIPIPSPAFAPSAHVLQGSVPVAIATTPPGATVMMDGRGELSCQTPCSLDAPPGRHSLTLTLAGTLVSSGLGGLWTGRRTPALLPASLAAAALALCLTAASLMLFSSQVLALPAPGRYIALLLAVALAGFLMGIPFPLGMRHLAQPPPAKSCAWAANGCASVLASILSAQIAISSGFAWVLAAAVLSYGIAFLAVLKTRLTNASVMNTVSL